MSVRLLFLRVVTGFMTCAPTRKAPTCAIVITRVIAGLKIAVHARVSFMRNINPCPAELLQLYFSSFEAGIANAISSFK